MITIFSFAFSQHIVVFFSVKIFPLLTKLSNVITSAYNSKLNFAQFHLPCFNHAGPNFLKQGPHFLVRDSSSGGLIVFIVIIVHDNIRTRSVTLLTQTHLSVERIQQAWKISCNRFQIWFWPVVVAYWKYCQSWRGHGGRDLTSSQMLSPAASLLEGHLKLHCNPPFLLRWHNSHAHEPWQQRVILQDIKNVNNMRNYSLKLNVYIVMSW